MSMKLGERHFLPEVVLHDGLQCNFRSFQHRWRCRQANPVQDCHGLYHRAGTVERVIQGVDDQLGAFYYVFTVERFAFTQFSGEEFSFALCRLRDPGGGKRRRSTHERTKQGG